jgi:DNA-binding transcriptional LysR family regulator
MLDADALLLLVDIVDAGGLSQAARKRRMSRANVSYHLAQMEGAAGVQLVRRTTRRIEVTEAGQRLYRHGCVIRDELLAAQESVASLAAGLHGHVRLAVPTGFGQMVMSHWLIEFKRQHPSITLSLVFDNRVDDLLRDEVDVAVRVLSEPPPSLVARELAPVRHIACASVGFVARHPCPWCPMGCSKCPSSRPPWWGANCAWRPTVARSAANWPCSPPWPRKIFSSCTRPSWVTWAWVWCPTTWSPTTSRPVAWSPPWTTGG